MVSDRVPPRYARERQGRSAGRPPRGRPRCCGL